jgi:replicative DNA helicase Mcm
MIMEKSDIIDQFSEFLRQNYYKELTKVVSKGEQALKVDFSLLDKFNPDLADEILENPEDAIYYANESIKEFDFSDKDQVNIRFFNLPESSNIRIRNIRAKNIGKLLSVDGIVKRASEVRPEVSEVIFECSDCGNKISIIQTEKEKTVKYPTRCDCGNRRNFRILKEKLYDARWISIEEPFEITTGERPSDIMVYLKEDLVSTKMRNKTEPGNRIKVAGILKEIPRRTQRGKQTRQKEILLDANNVETVELEWEELLITPEDEKKINEFAKDKKIYERLTSSLAPTMFGLEKEKLAIIFQLFGGTTHVLQDGTRIRGDIHLLLIGDPSVGKSQLLKLASGMIPRGKYVSGKGVTGAGLTAAVVKDEQFLGGWVLEAGALVLSNQSVCAIDEFEKMEKNDQVAMHEAMSLQQISIAKATIVATLPSRTAVLAGANPKLGRFDPYIPIREQVDLPETILSRFDVKFALRDVPSAEMDDKIISHILDSRHFKTDLIKPEMDPEFLRKYIAYAKKNCQPELSKEAAKTLKDFYVNLRSRSGGEDAPIPITLRQYEALIRLSEASAKIRLSSQVSKKDAERAIEIMKYSLRQFGFDPETGMIDIDRAEGGTPSTQRNKMRIVLDTLSELHEIMGKSVPMDEVIKRCVEQGVDNADEIIRKMKSEGLVFEPKPGFVQKV